MIISFENLEKELKTGKLDNIYLLYGEETFLLETALKRIKKNFGELLQGINYIVIEESTLDELISDLQTPAFGYEKKLILVKNANLFKKESKKKTNHIVELQEKINQYLLENKEEIEQTIILVFVEETIDKIELYKTIEKIGTVCQYEKLTLPQIVKRLRAISEAYHVKLSDDIARYLVEISGTNMQDLINEIRKLIEYTGENGTITKEAVEQLTTKQIDYIIFDLTDNLGNKKIEQGIEVLHGLIKNKEPAQKILITLYNHFKKLYMTKLAIKENANLAESLNLKPNQLFLTSKYKKQAELFEERTLRTLLDEFIELDRNSKNGKIDLNIGLEAILCEYCSK